MLLVVPKLIRNNIQLFVKISARSASRFYAIDDDTFGLNNEQKQLRSTIFDFAQKELAPIAKEIDAKDNFEGLRDFWLKLGELGLLGVTVNHEYGGSNGSFLEHIIIIEELSRACSAIAMSYGVHTGMCVNQIHRNGNEAQKRRYLPKLCRGEYLGALAITEAGAGSDIYSMKLRAYKEGDFYILNGHKNWTTNGEDADVFVVYAKTDLNTKPQEGISAFIVEKRFKGFSIGEKSNKLGMRGSSNNKILFDNCEVPCSNLLGTENKGLNVLLSGLVLERLVLAAVPLGIMQACCDLSFCYAHDREQFNRRIGEFQLIQGKMADMYTTVNACRSYLYNVARAADKGKFTAKDCAGVMLYCSEKATKMTLDTIQILGGNGYINDYPAGRYLRDAKLTEIAAGTNEIRKIIIGKAINYEL